MLRLVTPAVPREADVKSFVRRPQCQRNHISVFLRFSQCKRHHISLSLSLSYLKYIVKHFFQFLFFLSPSGKGLYSKYTVIKVLTIPLFSWSWLDACNHQTKLKRKPFLSSIHKPTHKSLKRVPKLGAGAAIAIQRITCTATKVLNEWVCFPPCHPTLSIFQIKKRKRVNAIMLPSYLLGPRTNHVSCIPCKETTFLLKHKTQTDGCYPL